MYNKISKVILCIVAGMMMILTVPVSAEEVMKQDTELTEITAENDKIESRAQDVQENVISGTLTDSPGSAQFDYYEDSKTLNIYNGIYDDGINFPSNISGFIDEVEHVVVGSMAGADKVVIFEDDEDGSTIIFSSPSFKTIKFENVDTTGLTNMIGMFYADYNLEKLDLGDNFDTSNVVNMEYMFQDNTSLTELNLGSKFITDNVNNMSFMFKNVAALETLDLGENFNTKSLTNASWMFDGMWSLKSLDLGDKFNTEKVVRMDFMFNDMFSLETLNLGDHFYTDNVEDMGRMFASMKSIEHLDLGEHFNTENVDGLVTMFALLDSLLSIKLGEHFKGLEETAMNEQLEKDGYGYGWILLENPTVKFTDSDDFMENYEYLNPNHHGTYVRPKISTVTYIGLESANTKHMFTDNFDLPNAPEREGYTFTGWIYEGEKYSAEESFMMPNHEVTFEADYLPNTYNVIFNNEDEQTTVEVAYDTKVESSEIPTTNKTGYTFKGWFSEIDGKGKAYDFLDEKIREHTEVFAYYTINQYNISFVTEEGDLISKVTENYGKTMPLLTIPDKEGCEGTWYYEGKKYDSPTGTYVVLDHDMEFVLHYDKIDENPSIPVEPVIPVDPKTPKTGQSNSGMYFILTLIISLFVFVSLWSKKSNEIKD